MFCVGKPRRTAPLLAAALGLACLPTSAAAGGYDIAHIVERTCEPGGSLIVADEWKLPRDRDRVIAEPGEVIACPSVGPKTSFQIAARHPKRIGRNSHLCTYFSLLDGDGADICLSADLAEGAGSVIEPLMAIRTDRSDRLALVGIASQDVATVAVTPTGGRSPEATVIPIERDRAERLGATAAFSYFSLTVERRTLCAEEHASVLGRDGSGRRVAENRVPSSTRLLSAADRVAYARPLKALCESEAAGKPASLDWLTEVSAVLRAFFEVWF